MNRFKGIVKLSQAQYDTLKEQGSITIKGKTFLYDPTNTIYVTKDSGVTANKVTSVNGETGDVTLTSESVNAVSKSVDTLIGGSNTILNTEDGISISGNKVNIGGTTDLAGSEVIGTQITSDNIQVKTSGSTQDYTPKIIDISSGEIAITGFDLTLDGKQVATLEDVQNGSSNGITKLVGTEDRPINFATDMELGKFYLISGVHIYKGTGTFATGEIQGELLAAKLNYNSTVTIFRAHQNGTSFNVGAPSISHCIVNIDETTGVVSKIQHYVCPTQINGSLKLGYSNDSPIYAPTTVGETGQVLTSSGSGAPVWSDLVTSEIETLVGTEETPINLATDLEKGKYYFISGYFTQSATYKSNIGERLHLCFKDVSLSDVTIYPNSETVIIDSLC